MNTGRVWHLAAAGAFILAMLGPDLPLGKRAAMHLGARLAHAEGSKPNIPENAHADRFRTGWECDRGFRKADEKCVAIDIPARR